MPYPSDDELERLVVSVRADTSVFARDVGTMRRELEGPFAGGVDRAGRAVEASLARAIRTGKLGFEDLKSVALSVMGDIAASAIRGGIGAILGGSGGGGGGGGGGSLLALGTAAAGAVFGLPGRATGGPVSPGRGYLVGERGPEMFVPTSSGSIATSGQGGGAREVRVTIAVNAPPGSAPDTLARSSRQVARSVRAALMSVED